MAVYKRTYAAYQGATTPRWSRFLILTRYSAAAVFQSRMIIGLYAICFLAPLIMIALLYLNHNARLLTLAHIRADHVLNVDGHFFMTLMSIQGSLAFLMTAFIGPGLISPDLTNNALPLYFCRPLSRSEYVLGRACVILLLLSFVTWIPGLLVFSIEASLSGATWASEHLRYAEGILVGSWLWMSILTLLALALSAWVRWRVVAGGLLLGVMFATSGFAAAVEAVVHSSSGFYLDPAALVGVIYANFFDIGIDSDISTTGACLAIVAMCALCVLLLSRKIRAFQVVR
jgi:ABC-2 type transport system permease protein